MQIANWLGLLTRSEATLGAAFDTVGQGHSRDAGIYFICRMLSGQCCEHVAELTPVTGRYAPPAGTDPDRLDVPGMPHVRGGARGRPPSSRPGCARRSRARRRRPSS